MFQKTTSSKHIFIRGVQLIEIILNKHTFYQSSVQNSYK